MNMQTTPVKDRRTAFLKNVSAMETLVETMRERGSGSSGIGVFSGPSGFGKTVAAVHCQDQCNCLYIEARSHWRPRDFCRAVLIELGREPKGSVSQMMEEIILVLGRDIGRVLIVDEADWLITGHMIELVRTVQEKSRAPVILVGEEKLPERLAQHERCHNRVAEWVLALPCDVQDARVLARRLAPDVEIDDALLTKFCADTKWRARRIANTDRKSVV